MKRTSGWRTYWWIWAIASTVWVGFALAAFPQTRDYYWQRYEAARDSLKLEAYDVRETGNMDDAAEDVPAKGNIWLGPAPTRRRVA